MKSYGRTHFVTVHCSNKIILERFQLPAADSLLHLVIIMVHEEKLTVKHAQSMPLL